MSTALASAAIAARLVELPHWRHEGAAITRLYKTGGWKATLMAVNLVGYLAEAAWHHPQLTATFGALEVRLDTHDAGGVTDKDFALAAQIEALLMQPPGAPFMALPPEHEIVKA